jgi:hypothetical protein
MLGRCTESSGSIRGDGKSGVIKNKVVAFEGSREEIWAVQVKIPSEQHGQVWEEGCGTCFLAIRKCVSEFRRERTLISSI